MRFLVNNCDPKVSQGSFLHYVRTPNPQTRRFTPKTLRWNGRDKSQSLITASVHWESHGVFFSAWCFHLRRTREKVPCGRETWTLHDSSIPVVDAQPELRTEGISIQAVLEIEIFVLGKRLTLLCLTHLPLALYNVCTDQYCTQQRLSVHNEETTDVSQGHNQQMGRETMAVSSSTQGFPRIRSGRILEQYLRFIILLLGRGKWP